MLWNHISERAADIEINHRRVCVAVGTRLRVVCDGCVVGVWQARLQASLLERIETSQHEDRGVPHAVIVNQIWDMDSPSDENASKKISRMRTLFCPLT
jgi:hypothetical protein